VQLDGECKERKREMIRYWYIKWLNVYVDWSGWFMLGRENLTASRWFAQTGVLESVVASIWYYLL